MMSYGHDGYNSVMNGSECFWVVIKSPVSLIYSPKQTSHQVATVVTPAATEESSEVGVMQICTKQHIHIFTIVYIYVYNSAFEIHCLFCEEWHYTMMQLDATPKQTNPSDGWNA